MLFRLSCCFWHVWFIVNTSYYWLYHWPTLQLSWQMLSGTGEVALQWCHCWPNWTNELRRLVVFQAGSCCRIRRVVFQLLTSVPLHGFQRSTAAALCDLTTEVLRTINATENAMVEYGLSEPVDRSHLVGTDVKQADDAFRELEENVSFKHELHAPFSPNLFLWRSNCAQPSWLVSSMTEMSGLALNLPGCCVTNRAGYL